MSTFYILFFYKNYLNYLNYLRNLCPVFIKNINIITYLQLWNFKNFFISLSTVKSFFYNFCNILKKHNNFLFYSVVDIACIDFPSQQLRYSLNYNFFSFIYNIRLFIKIDFEEWYSISSITSLYSSSGWLEREVWDMFGVFFFENYDLRRILTDYGFKYFPLRKDFPLSGFLEIRYDDFSKSLIYEPVEFAQEYRRFEFKNSW